MLKRMLGRACIAMYTAVSAVLVGGCRREEFKGKSQALDVLKLLWTKCQYKCIIYRYLYIIWYAM